MKVLIPYADLLNDGGTPSYARGLAVALSRVGHTVLGVSVAQSQQSDTVRRALRVPVRTIQGGSPGRSAFRAIVTEFQPHIVHLVGGPGHPVHWGWSRYLRELGVPYVISGCGNLGEGSLRHRPDGKLNHALHYWMKKACFHALDRDIIRNAAAVHANAEHEAELARGLGAQHTIVAPFGLDEEPHRDLMARFTRSSRGPVTFTHVGPLSPVPRGLDLAIEAFGRVARAGLGDRFRLILAGPDERGALGRLKQRAEAAGISSVTLPGPVTGDERQKIWDQTDYFLNLSRFHGFAPTAREALCQGIPMVATLESDYGDWVSAFDMGVVTPLDPGGLARVITDLIATGEVRYREWTRNVAGYLAQTDLESVGRTFGEGYERVLASLDVSHIMGRYTLERTSTVPPVPTGNAVASLGSSGPLAVGAPVTPPPRPDRSSGKTPIGP